MIWEQAPHQAFTSLTWFEGRWYCAFREGEEHACHHGALRVIASSDGVVWESAARLTSPEPRLPDLRDPKIGITPGGELLLLGAATSRDPSERTRSFCWRSREGSDWSAPAPIGNDGIWLWGWTSEGGTLYASGYGSPRERIGVTLYRADAPPAFEKVALLCNEERHPNETALHFHHGHGVAIIRRELAEGQLAVPPFNNGTALLATATAPYTEWECSDLGLYIGGPMLLRLPSGELLLAGRRLDENRVHQCALWRVDEAERRLEQLLILPSGGDCSYPGMVWRDGALYLSYYSEHEGRAKIYFATITF